VTYDKALANRQRLDFTTVPTPAFTGARQVDVDLAELVPYIDWTFFFTAWELKGRFPADSRRPEARRGGARALRSTPARCCSASSTAS
jgi:5-methyltetrahydrofolate--homocysteine methyltransferase